jgi:UDP-3-O-acyl N-acetylglucosamine deacetylase
VGITGQEVPFTDGSAEPIVKVMKEAGIVEQGKARRYLDIEGAIVFREDGVEITGLPSEELRITFFVDYPGTIIGKQAAHFEVNEETFSREIAPARTFCFLRDIEMLREKGLIKGGSLEHSIVIGDEGIINEEQLRYEDEFVRHKVLDFMGDLNLLGRRLRGHIISNKSGHLSNIKFVKKLIEGED